MIQITVYQSLAQFWEHELFGGIMLQTSPTPSKHGLLVSAIYVAFSHNADLNMSR